MTSEINRIHHSLKTGEITCTELIREKLGLLEKNTNNSVNFLLTDLALEKAAKVDEKIRNGQDTGLLEGVPFGLKDVYLLAGYPAAASSDILKNYKSPYTASAIQRLLDAGAIPLVKENCDCFGHGSSSENTVFGPVKNALDPTLVAGGSSGGSAVNVAKGYTAFSIGGDTGGSIRQPAGYNKIYALKPTYGRISRYGLMAYASSTDCVGPLAKSLEDIRILLNVMSGKDPRDQTTIESVPVPEKVFNENVKNLGIKVGYYKSFINNEALDPGIKQDFLKVVKTLQSQGIDVIELDFFDTDILVSSYYTIAMAETASNLSRLDGTNYGARSQANTLKEGYALTRSENFTEETKRRIVGGNQVLSHGYSESIYIKANNLRDQIVQRFSAEFKSVDLIISPVAPQLPAKIGTTLKDPLAMYLSDAYTVGFSLGGLPTLTTPVGTAVGMQVTAAKNNEGLILTFAKFLEGLWK